MTIKLKRGNEVWVEGMSEVVSLGDARKIADGVTSYNLFPRIGEVMVSVAHSPCKFIHPRPWAMTEWGLQVGCKNFTREEAVLMAEVVSEL